MSVAYLALCSAAVLAAVAVFLARGPRSRPLAGSVALAAATMLLFPRPVDRQVSAAIYPHLGHLAADCFITGSLYLMMRAASSRPLPIVWRYSLALFVAPLCGLFFSIPADRVPERVSAVMFTDPIFFAYAMTANVAAVLYAVKILRSRVQVSHGVDHARANVLLKVVGTMSIVYVTARVCVPAHVISEAVSQGVSVVFAVVVSVALAGAFLLEAASYRRHVRADIAELSVLYEYLLDEPPWRLTPLRRIGLAMRPTHAMVDLMADTSDAIALLPNSHPVKKAAGRSADAPATQAGLVLPELSVRLARISLFAAARAARHEIDESHGTPSDPSGGD